jgi:hypothetical protein
MLLPVADSDGPCRRVLWLRPFDASSSPVLLLSLATDADSADELGAEYSSERDDCAGLESWACVGIMAWAESIETSPASPTSLQGLCSARGGTAEAGDDWALRSSSKSR